MSARHAMRRLQAFDIRGRLARNTTLMELASELPAVVLSRLLGLNIDSATTWNPSATGHRAAYAATSHAAGSLPAGPSTLISAPPSPKKHPTPQKRRPAARRRAKEKDRLHRRRALPPSRRPGDHWPAQYW